MKEAFEAYGLQPPAERVTATFDSTANPIARDRPFCLDPRGFGAAGKCKAMVAEGLADRSARQAAALVDRQAEEPHR